MNATWYGVRAWLEGGFELPGRIAGMLYAHQLEGVRWLWSLQRVGKGGILGDDMGLGKTMQVRVKEHARVFIGLLHILQWYALVSSSMQCSVMIADWCHCCYQSYVQHSSHSSSSSHTSSQHMLSNVPFPAACNPHHTPAHLRALLNKPMATTPSETLPARAESMPVTDTLHCCAPGVRLPRWPPQALQARPPRPRRRAQNPTSALAEGAGRVRPGRPRALLFWQQRGREGRRAEGCVLCEGGRGRAADDVWHGAAQCGAAGAAEWGRDRQMG